MSNLAPEQCICFSLCLWDTDHPSYRTACQTQSRHVWTHQTKPKILWKTNFLQSPVAVTHLSLSHPSHTLAGFSCHLKVSVRACGYYNQWLDIMCYVPQWKQFAYSFLYPKGCKFDPQVQMPNNHWRPDIFSFLHYFLVPIESSKPPHMF